MWQCGHADVDASVPLQCTAAMQRCTTPGAGQHAPSAPRDGGQGICQLAGQDVALVARSIALCEHLGGSLHLLEPPVMRAGQLLAGLVTLGERPVQACAEAAAHVDERPELDSSLDQQVDERIALGPEAASLLLPPLRRHVAQRRGMDSSVAYHGSTLQ